MSKIIVLMLVIVVFIGTAIGTGIMTLYHYSVEVGQYLKLSDDASEASIKLKYLIQYKDAINEYVKRDNARYIFTQQQFTKNTQLEILDTLIVRLTDISQMDRKSFEYQTAMQQVTGQEFNHTLCHIDNIFWDCYRRSSIWRWFCTYPGLES